MAKSRQYLIDICNSYVEKIEKGGDACEFLEATLDYEFTIGRYGKYLGGRVCVAFGGPGIWVNTRDDTVERFGWGDAIIRPYKDNMGLSDEMLKAYKRSFRLVVYYPKY